MSMSIRGELNKLQQCCLPRNAAIDHNQTHMQKKRERDREDSPKVKPRS